MTVTDDTKVVIPITLVTDRRTREGACPCGCCGLCCK